jgi:hypothetical protein
VTGESADPHWDLGGGEHGSVTEEATRLLAAAQQWVHHTLGERDSSRFANGSPECCWCPLCQLIATLRGDRPEVIERLAEAQTAVVGLLRALTAAAGATTPAGPATPAGAGEPAGPGEPADPFARTAQTAADRPTGSPRVHRIELDEEPPAGPGDDAFDELGVDDGPIGLP